MDSAYLKTSLNVVFENVTLIGGFGPVLKDSQVIEF